MPTTLLAQTPMRWLTKKSGCSLLLDSYTGATAAYSAARKLDCDYAGSAMRVRRSSDNAEQDIGFTNNVLDTASLLSFVTSNSGYVTKWYDQSGSVNDAVQTTSANQPRIVDAGVIFRSNGQPAVDFGTESQEWGLVLPTGYLNGATSIGYFQVATITDFAASNGGVFGPSNTFSVGLQILQVSVISDPTFISINGTIRTVSGFWNNATQTISSLHGNATDVTAFNNSVSVSMLDGSAMPALNFNGIYSIGFYTSISNDMRGNINELIIYPLNKTATRAGIETNINGFYLTF